MDLSAWIESNRSMFVELSNEVWGYAELGYHEHKSSQTLEDALEEEGFKLERGVAELTTAFVASYGNADGPVIGILGEFDALPGLSQDCVPYRKPLENGAPGHGCEASYRRGGSQRTDPLLWLPCRRGRRGKSLHGKCRRV